jgi:thymidylate synthase (FAD)
MIVTILDHTQQPEVTVGRMAAICYDADTGDEACIRRAKKCKDSGHLATMRFAYATFNVSGISRVCSHQIVRMAHAGILQRSQRYVKEAKVEYIDPPALAECSYDDQFLWAGIQDQAEHLYLKLVETKQMKKEDARYILPQGCTTELNLCLNFQGWRDFLKNRADKHAQWEVREVAYAIQQELSRIAPNIFSA